MPLKPPSVGFRRPVSHGEAGKGRKAPYGLTMVPPLSTLSYNASHPSPHCIVLETLGEPLGEKTPFHRLFPLLSRLSHGGRLGRP